MKRKRKYEYPQEDLNSYMAVPVKEKLKMLEKMNDFFDRFMPAQSKKAWKKLQEKGF
jgi:hypothetical protein